MNLASLLGGGDVHTQMNPLAGVLGGTAGLLGTSGVTNELAGLCVLLGNQQSHNVSLTNLQVVELQRAVAAQELATERQGAATVQAMIAEKVAEELKEVARATLLHRLYSRVRRNKTGTATFRHLDLVTLLKVHGGEQNMLSEPQTSLPTRKRTRSSIVLQVNSM